MSPTPPAEIDSMSRINLVVAWIGAIAGSVSVLVWSGVAVATGDARDLLEAIGPLALAIVSGTMLLKGRIKGELILFVATLHITLTVSLSHRDETLMAAALGLVLILAVGALLIPVRRRVAYGIGTAFYGLGVGWLWDGVYLGTTMMVTTALSVATFFAVHAASRTGENRYRTLFAGVPVPLALQDWRGVRARLEKVRAAGVTDLATYFEARPDELQAFLEEVRMVDVNEAFVQLVGAESRAAVVNGWAQRPMAENGRDSTVAHLQALADGNTRGQREWQGYTLDGRSPWVHMDWEQMPDGALPDADRLAAFTDITALKRVECELHGLLDAKDQFVASISHELRTPLTAVLGFGETLLSGAIPAEDRDEILELLVAEARDMADIIEDLLVAARARLGEINVRSETVDLIELSSKVAKNAEVEFDIEPAVGITGMGDTTRVAQILRNLVVNASRYGGLRRRMLFGLDDGAVWVEVRDDGDGIPDWLEESLFDPYVSGEARTGLAPSIGLGLWVSRELAGLMGGSLEYVRADSETIFRLTLPSG